VGMRSGRHFECSHQFDSSIRATGIDVSEVRLSKRRKKSGELASPICLRDAQSMEVSVQTASTLVYCRMLLQYLKEKERAVSEMARVCKPGWNGFLQDLDGQLLWHYPENPSVQRTL